MKKNIIIAIRYSIIQKNSASWRAAELSFEDYANKILSNERLNIREQTFKSLTLKSLCNQINTDKNVTYTVLIMVSDMLPEGRIDRLRSMINENNISGLDFKIVKIDSGTGLMHDHININEAIKATIKRNLANLPEALLATVRLDDDDGLSTNFIEKLSHHMRPGLTGYAVSFAYGVEGYWDSAANTVSDLKHSYFPKSAFGLAYLNAWSQIRGLEDNKTIHVYNMGNHMKIDENYPTIVDATEPMYFRTLSSTNDSVGSPYHKNLPSIKGKNTLSNFGYLVDLHTEQSLPDYEDIKSLEICKSSSPWMALITHLNNRIQLREKQIRELTARLEGNKP
ncbi:glycosyltransferase [Pseudomonas sp. NMI542_15]|uniref:glycosyltransferase n=1 Tax=Pseudomonas sp. NMI542_15 TaxID=2903148 RepID=UPI001E2FE07A|nr:glycosyltransferase [Pseudomonas sp. NMI542_15]MCE0780830.1 putative rhamnosyl transferase [Pseudomonas sp. NMI542_15]